MERVFPEGFSRLPNGWTITFPNKWTLSVRFGTFNECTNYLKDSALEKAEELHCPDADVGIFNPDGEMVRLNVGESDHINHVYVSPEFIPEYMNLVISLDPDARRLSKKKRRKLEDLLIRVRKRR